MIRTLLWMLGGLTLGVVIHLAVILSMPALAQRNLWTYVSGLDALQKVVVLETPGIGEPNPLGLDPKLAYALCRLDLSDGPGVVTGSLPQGFWSLSVYDRNGVAIYSTTNRAGIGETLDLGLFNPAQTRLLAEQQIEIEEGLLIVETAGDDVFVAVRLAAPHAAMLGQFKQALGNLTCGNVAI